MDQAERGRGLGGTDMAAVMGVSPWRDRTDVWMEKVGHPMWRPRPVTPAMHWGTLLEPVVRAAYTADTGIEVVPPPPRTSFDEPEVAIWSPDGIRFAHPDGFAGAGIWEGKTGSEPRDWERGVPVYYEVQVQQYLDITERPWADVSVLLPGGDFRTYRVQADPVWQLEMSEEAAAFWSQYVLPKVPPGPVPAEVRWPVADRELTLEATQEQVALLTEYRAVVDAIASSEARRDEIKEVLKDAMQQAGHMTAPGLRVDFTHSKPSTSVGWEQVATSLWNTLEMLRRMLPEDLPDDVMQYLDPALYGTLVGLYSTTGKATRPFVVRQVKEGKQ